HADPSTTKPRSLGIGLGDQSERTVCRYDLCFHSRHLQFGRCFMVLARLSSLIQLGVDRRALVIGVSDSGIELNRGAQILQCLLAAPQGMLGPPAIAAKAGCAAAEFNGARVA